MENGDEMMNGKYVCAAVVMLVITLGMLMTANAGAQTPIVTASFDQSSRTANVEPGNPTNGSVSNTGVINCDVGNRSRVTVNLAVAGGNWTASISPTSQVYFTGGPTQQNFDITVHAPIGTSHKVSQNVVVGGNWTADDNSTGEIGQSSMIVFIEQYFSIEVEPVEDLKAKGKEEITIEVTVWNDGNDEDDFILEIANQMSLTNSGWYIPTIPKLTIAEKESGDVDILLTAPSKSGTFDIELIVISERSRLNNPDQEKNATVTIRIKVDGDDDDDDGIPFVSPFELIGVLLLVALVGRYRGRRT